MFLDLKQSLIAIDNEIDLLTDRFDCLKDNVDKHDKRINQFESCTSEVENEHSAAGEKVLEMKKVLELVRNINKDLEACLKRNNLQILRVL
ncbi:hypothetical protein NDU88_003364 [Pleurodeles waltl]|uniref:Uncharacterized protein n=1 Tax=Pleurodeles waltl TaxID=8319 RepID=A0AAV7LID3_PLEWA|nr:hypothetical protein NDU88_003364 [Pleurodeles waltl]